MQQGPSPITRTYRLQRLHLYPASKYHDPRETVALIEAVGIRCVKPPPHQQQCRSKSYDSFDKVERCFDTVAVFGNNDERVFFREISSFRQSRNKWNMFNLCRLCRNDETLRKYSFGIVAKNGYNVEAKFDFVEATFDFVV